MKKKTPTKKDPKLGQKKELHYRVLMNIWKRNLAFYKQAAEDCGVRIEFKEGGVKEEQKDNPELMHMVTAEPEKFNFSTFYLRVKSLKRGYDQ